MDIRSVEGARRFWRRSLGAGMGLVLAMSSTACDLLSPDGVSNCGSEETTVQTILAPFTPPDPETATIDGGQAVFTWSTELSGLCSQGSHGDTKVYFTVLTDPSIPEPPNLTMEGRVYHAAFIRPYTAREDQRLAGAPDPDGTPRKAIRAKLEEVGLKQGNPDGTPARIINEVALWFTSSGNIDVDRELASRLVKEVEIATQWRRPK